MTVHYFNVMHGGVNRRNKLLIYIRIRAAERPRMTPKDCIGNVVRSDISNLCGQIRDWVYFNAQTDILGS